MSRLDWDDYDRAAERGPVTFMIKAVCGLAIVGAVAGGISYAFGWIGEAATVAQKEVGPNALLQKYMWLKETHAQLEKKQADIKVMQTSLDSLTTQYQGVPRNKWAHIDLDTWGQKSEELAGTKMSYNNLAAEYNAKMKEVNWRFCNVGDLPQGATEALPREYVSYTEN